MSETNTYYRYHEDRVLLATARMYRPQFAAAWVYLNGAQVEMLRNMTQYLNRPNTYVEEYEIDKYKTPSASQFDDIQAIVADLEEKLMGSNSTPWGYSDRLNEKENHTKSGAGNYTMTIIEVPSGYVYVIGTIISNDIGTQVVHKAKVCTDTDCTTVNIEQATASGAAVVHDRVHYVLKEGDRIQVVFEAAQDGDLLTGNVLGYSMDVS